MAIFTNVPLRLSSQPCVLGMREIMIATQGLLRLGKKANPTETLVGRMVQACSSTGTYAHTRENCLRSCQFPQPEIMAGTLNVAHDDHVHGAEHAIPTPHEDDIVLQPIRRAARAKAAVFILCRCQDVARQMHSLPQHLLSMRRTRNSCAAGLATRRCRV